MTWQKIVPPSQIVSWWSSEGQRAAKLKFIDSYYYISSALRNNIKKTNRQTYNIWNIKFTIRFALKICRRSIPFYVTAAASAAAFWQMIFKRGGPSECDGLGLDYWGSKVEIVEIYGEHIGPLIHFFWSRWQVNLKPPPRFFCYFYGTQRAFIFHDVPFNVVWTLEPLCKGEKCGTASLLWKTEAWYTKKEEENHRGTRRGSK